MLGDGEKAIIVTGLSSVSACNCGVARREGCDMSLFSDDASTHTHIHTTKLLLCVWGAPEHEREQSQETHIHVCSLPSPVSSAGRLFPA